MSALTLPEARTVSYRRPLIVAAIWLLLLAAPFWMPLFGGYTALATRILVFGLAAMSLNFLLGFTGVLSFGHAAYFGLGAYGTGLALKYLAPSTPLALLMGVLLGTAMGALLGALIVRKRGVYFDMVTIAFGQVFYFIAFRWRLDSWRPSGRVRALMTSCLPRRRGRVAGTSARAPSARKRRRWRCHWRI